MFVRYISHEIRTPLNTVLMGLQVVHEELTADGAGRDRLETIKDVESSCEIAINILNDLLVFDKLEAGILKLEITSLPAYSFIEETIKPFYLQVKYGI